MTAVADEAELFATIQALLAAHNPAGIEIRLDTDLAADLSLDSVAAMDLVMGIEERYDLDIPVNEISELRTVGDLVALVRRCMREQRG